LAVKIQLFENPSDGYTKLEQMKTEGVAGLGPLSSFYIIQRVAFIGDKIDLYPLENS
jgi:hypothetical protein